MIHVAAVLPLHTFKAQMGVAFEIPVSLHTLRSLEEVSIIVAHLQELRV